MFVPQYFWAQQAYSVKGKIVSARTEMPLPEVMVSVTGSSLRVETDAEGEFNLEVFDTEIVIELKASDYLTKRIPISFYANMIDLGLLLLEEDIASEQTDNLITLTENELTDDGIASNPSGLLQATRDLFLSRAAFDFGQAFFRVRGYDSQNGNISINGIKMNKFYDGRPQWNNWGGLNDVVRNQQFTHSLAPSDYTFGGILGNTNIDTRPSGLRAGTRLTLPLQIEPTPVGSWLPIILDCRRTKLLTPCQPLKGGREKGISKVHYMMRTVHIWGRNIR